MARRPEGSIGRIVVQCALLALATLCTFSLDPVDGHGDRINFLVTAILAFVAFQFIVASQLPMTSYLTLLDKYTQVTFAFLVLLQLTLSALNRSSYDRDTRGSIDNILFFVSMSTVVGIQLIFGIVAYFRRNQELRKLTMSMSELDKVNTQSDDTPINVYGDGEIFEDSSAQKGDPALTFSGSPR
jgi:hypothetical protein